jgi:hypothetical protein
MITQHSNGTPLNQQDIKPDFSSPPPQNSSSSHPSGNHAHPNEGRPRDPTPDTAETPLLFLRAGQEVDLTYPARTTPPLEPY